MHKYAIAGIGAAVLVLLAGGAVYVFSHSRAPVPESGFVASTTPEAPSGVVTDAAPGIPAGDKQYENVAYHFSLDFPGDLTWHEYHENGGALTVTFHKEDDSNGGFQIYITPYTDTQVTAARFRLDEPSGVKLSPTAVVIDGTPASMFFSTNAIMGDTREVWFIKNGFLYEVTTYKELDSWLAGIMQTWKFL